MVGELEGWRESVWRWGTGRRESTVWDKGYEEDDGVEGGLYANERATALRLVLLVRELVWRGRDPRIQVGRFPSSLDHHHLFT